MFLRKRRRFFQTFAFIFLLSGILLSIKGRFWAAKQRVQPIVNDRTHTPISTAALKQLLNCSDQTLNLKKMQVGDYWILQNLIIGEKTKNINCAETITYTTTSDYTYLKSLPILLKRWMAPVSFALYAPGFDFNMTMNSIQFLRNCIPERKLIRDYVTFHIYFPTNHTPQKIPLDEPDAIKWNFTCQQLPPYLSNKRSDLYRTKVNLSYTVNVGRNIARSASNTYFIFACDNELIPSIGLVSKFLEMIANNFSILHGNNGRRVFAIPVFEVHAKAKIPKTKVQLIRMLNQNVAIPFHSLCCPHCHNLPNYTLWLNTTYKNQLSITSVEKRQGDFCKWEPFFISDNTEPMFDERVTWEGQSNRRIQGFAMCLLDYEFYILHPVFLTHMPGIKTVTYERLIKVPEMNYLIKTKLEPEYRIVYGNKMGCTT